MNVLITYFSGAIKHGEKQKRFSSSGRERQKEKGQSSERRRRGVCERQREVRDHVTWSFATAEPTDNNNQSV